MKNSWVLLIVFIFAWIGNLDYVDEITQREHYCEMVALWHEHGHLPPEQRPGWPPYDGECDND